VRAAHNACLISGQPQHRNSSHMVPCTQVQFTCVSFRINIVVILFVSR
jgi:hypothetical protein